MYLYLYHGGNKVRQRNSREREPRSAFGEELIRKALYDYAARQELNIPDIILAEAVITIGEKGKPYFSGLPETGGEGMPAVHYSVSHSGDLWGCLMAEEPVGFDMEICRDRIHYEKIARRFFTEDECRLILSAGPDAFFDVWVRKEAYVKYLGSGLAEGLDRFSVVGGGALSSGVILKDGTVSRPPCFIRPCEIRSGVKAAYCSGSGNPVKAVIPL